MLNEWLIPVALFAISFIPLYLVSRSEKLERFDVVLARTPAPAVYLTRSDVLRAFRHLHYIPLGKGWTQRYFALNYPGWEWQILISSLQAAGTLRRDSEARWPDMTEGWEGVLLDGQGGFTLDHGELDHPVKSARREPVSGVPSQDTTDTTRE
jgi:hypothetical protein